MGSPVTIRFADGTERCAECKGFGLLRDKGPRAGTRYKTLNGAQTAYAHGNARDCPQCEGSGLVGYLDTLASWGVDRLAVNDAKIDLGVRGPVMWQDEGSSRLVRSRLRGEFDTSPAPF